MDSEYDDLIMLAEARFETCERELATEIAEWLRTTPRVRGVQISIHSSQDLARLADAIERMEFRNAR